MKSLSLFILIFCVLTPVSLAQRQLLDRVIAVANDEVITQSELDILLGPIYQQLQNEFQGRTLMQKINEVRRKLLNQLIEDRLVFQEAKSMGITVKQAEIDKQMRSFRKQFKNEADMEDAMKAEGLTFSLLEERLRRQSMVRLLHNQQVRAFVVVSPREIEEYYNNNKKEFMSQESIKISSITIKKNDEARRKGLKDEFSSKKIEAIRSEILSGSAFEDLAREHSEDTRAEDGGISDWIERGVMIPAIDQIIFSLSKGELSEIVETSMGYHLFRVEEKKVDKELSFEEAREAIHNKLYSMKAQTRFDEWMTELKRNAYISVR